MANNKIRLMVSDMDGTLLDSKGLLNSEFFSVYERLKESDIIFVAASGRQYYNLLKIFDSIKDEIAFIAENGAYVIFRSQELLIKNIPVDRVRDVIREVRNIEGAFPVLCGKKQAYIENELLDFVSQARTYYEKCTIVPDLLEITDDIFLKVAIYDFNGSAINSYPILKQFDKYLKVVVSGQNWLDISHQLANKGNALKFIQEYFSISEAECIAFGDQMNDVEMLQTVKYSYAMENAPDSVKCFSKYLAPSNNANGVLSVIKRFLK